MTDDDMYNFDFGAVGIGPTPGASTMMSKITASKVAQTRHLMKRFHTAYSKLIALLGDLRRKGVKVDPKLIQTVKNIAKVAYKQGPMYLLKPMSMDAKNKTIMSTEALVSYIERKYYGKKPKADITFDKKMPLSLSLSMRWAKMSRTQKVMVGLGLAAVVYFMFLKPKPGARPPSPPPGPRPY